MLWPDLTGLLQNTPAKTDFSEAQIHSSSALFFKKAAALQSADFVSLAQELCCFQLSRFSNPDSLLFVLHFTYLVFRNRVGTF